MARFSGPGRAGQEQVALARVAGEAGRALELTARFFVPAELRQQVAADARQEVIAGQPRLRNQAVDCNTSTAITTLPVKVKASESGVSATS